MARVELFTGQQKDMYRYVMIDWKRARLTVYEIENTKQDEQDPQLQGLLGDELDEFGDDDDAESPALLSPPPPPPPPAPPLTLQRAAASGLS